MPLIEVLDVADDPDAWRAAGFLVDDDDVCRLGTVRVRLLGADPTAPHPVRAWAVAGLDEGGSIDGVETRTSDLGPAEPAAHPNGATHIDHVVMSSPAVDRSVAALRRFGFEPRRVREFTGRDGTPARQVFYRMGEVILELAGPDQPRGDDPGPARLGGLALTSADLDATVAGLGEHISTPKDAVQPGRRIATLRGRDFGVVTPIAFLTPDAEQLARAQGRPAGAM